MVARLGTILEEAAFERLQALQKQSGMTQRAVVEALIMGPGNKEAAAYLERYKQEKATAERRVGKTEMMEKLRELSADELAKLLQVAESIKKKG
jgi:transcriptional regulator with XRE-family HTH domain